MLYKGFLFTGDLHLRSDVPICRTDNFLEAQWAKLEQIQKIAKSRRLCWIDAGDIFHKAIPSLHFVNQVLTRLDYPIYAGIMGNHDLPAHNIGRIMESAWGTLYESRNILHVLGSLFIHTELENGYGVNLYGSSYGAEIVEPYTDTNINNSILVMHDMVYAHKADIIPNAPGSLAKKLLRDHPQYDLIVCGHNHQSFMIEVHGRYLANVGSMMRQTADQSDHKPRVLQWHPKHGPEWICLDIEDGVVSREHIDKKQQKEKELNAFVESLQNVDEVSLSFEDNVEAVMRETRPDKSVKDKVREAME